MTEIISKTTFTFTVLHRTDNPPSSLEDALAEAYDGHAVGIETVTGTVEVPAAAVAGELVGMGNDGSFFDDDLTDDD